MRAKLTRSGMRVAREAIGVDTLGHEIAHGLLRSPLPEGQIVLVGAPLVTVAFDQNELVRESALSQSALAFRILAPAGRIPGLSKSK